MRKPFRVSSLQTRYFFVTYSFYPVLIPVLVFFFAPDVSFVNFHDALYIIPLFCPRCPFPAVVRVVRVLRVVRDKPDFSPCLSAPGTGDKHATGLAIELFFTS
jgi:hypothetical protein